MRWLTNGRRSDEERYIRDLMVGHHGKRSVIAGNPKPGKYTVRELRSMGYRGYYEVEPCQCDHCKKMRRIAYYKPLEDWKAMNEDIISRKEEEHRAEIREAHTYPPVTRRIVLDMGVDDETKMELCAFIGRVLAMAEYSNMLGYALTIKRSEELQTEKEARNVYYDLIIDVDVSSTIEAVCTELMGGIHTLASRMELIGNGLNIIRMEE